MRLVLASASPRRKQILKDAGCAYEAIDPGDAEDAVGPASLPAGTEAGPTALAIAKARAKAVAVASRLAPPFPAIVVGVDTIVALDDEVIGKPADRADAIRILTRLSGTRQRVISGLCLWLAPKEQSPSRTPLPLSPAVPCYRCAADTSIVTMRPMTAEEIAAYVASGEADGKAGAYAVQETGDRFVRSIEGSFLNVVGFPLELFRKQWAEAVKEWGDDEKRPAKRRMKRRA